MESSYFNMTQAERFIKLILLGYFRDKENMELIYILLITA